MPVPGLDGGWGQADVEVEGGIEGGQRSEVQRAAHFIAGGGGRLLGAGGAFHRMAEHVAARHWAGIDHGPDPILKVLADVEKPGEHGSQQPLVARARIHVAAEFGDVQLHHARRMGAIHQGEDAPLPRQGADFPHRQHAAVRVVDMAEADEPSALGHGLFKRRDDGVRALRRMKRIALEVHHHRLDAVPGRAQVDGLDAAGVIVVGVDDLVTRAKVEPQGAEGHALRGVVG